MRMKAKQKECHCKSILFQKSVCRPFSLSTFNFKAVTDALVGGAGGTMRATGAEGGG